MLFCTQVIVSLNLIKPVAAYTAPAVGVTYDGVSSDVFEITVTQGLHGLISPGTASYIPSSYVNELVVPDSGYFIESITVDGSPITITNPAGQTVSFSDIQANHSIRASFALDNDPALDYTVLVTQGVHGLISPGTASYIPGGTLYESIVPDSGYFIASIIVDGSPFTVTSPGGQTVHFSNIHANHSVTATFALDYTVMVTQSLHGLISPGTASYERGSNVYEVVTPDSGYFIESITVDGSPITVAYVGGQGVWFNNVQGNHSITASFACDYVIMVTQSLHGLISPGTASYERGSNVYEVVTPDSGYFIESITVDGSPITVAYVGGQGVWFNNVQGNHSITASFACDYVIMVTQSLHGLISPGTASYERGSNVYEVVTPDSGYFIESITVDGSPITVAYVGGQGVWFNNVQGNHSITASFACDYVIMVTQSLHGLISPGTASYERGSNVYEVVTPDSGYFIESITVDGSPITVAYVGGQGVWFNNVQGNHSITASFTLDHEIAHDYVITVTQGLHGLISPSTASYTPGGNVYESIVPDSGYFIASIIVDGSPFTVTSPIGQTVSIINIQGNHSVTATFALDYTVMVTQGLHGLISPGTSSYYDPGNSVYESIVPDSGYFIASIIVDGSPFTVTSPIGQTVSFINIQGNHSVTATFALDYTVMVTQGLHGLISPGTSSYYDPGNSVYESIVPDSGYFIASIIVDGSPFTVTSPGGQTVSFINIQGNHSVTATFALDYTVMVTQGLHGLISPGTSSYYDPGNSVYESIVPDSGYFIASIIVDGSPFTVTSPGGQTVSFINIQGNHSVTATFALDYTVMVTQGLHGLISPGTSSYYDPGNSVYESIVPDSGYFIASIIVDGSPFTVTSPIGQTVSFINIQGNHSITASFTINYTVTVTQGLHGSISPTTAIYNAGSNVYEFVAPDSGYFIESITVDGSSITVTSLGDQTVRFNKIQANHSITASFTLNYTRTLSTMNEVISTTAELGETVNVQTATLQTLVTGDLSGSLNFTNLEIVQISSGSFVGEGFSKGTYNARIEGSQYQGDWQGIIFNVPGENKTCLKGTLSVGLQGILEGFLSESVNGSNIFDSFVANCTISHIGSSLVYAILNLDGIPSYRSSVAYPSTGLYVLQTQIQGQSSGYYYGPLTVSTTHVSINSSANPYYGQGFSILSYVTDFGSGEGWTYDNIAQPNVFEMKGFFNEPLIGVVSGILYDSSPSRVLSIGVEKIKIGLPPQADLKVNVWGPERVSPGQTVNYIVEYMNDGLIAVDNTQIKAALPEYVEFVSCSGNGYCDWEVNTVFWDITNVNAKSINSLSITVRAKWGLASGTILKTTVLAYPLLLSPSSNSPETLSLVEAKAPSYLTPVSSGSTSDWRQQLKKGDILIEHSNGGQVPGYWDHVGIYDGNGYVISSVLNEGGHSGPIKESIEKWDVPRRTDVGILRVKDATQAQINAAVAFAEAELHKNLPYVLPIPPIGYNPLPRLNGDLLGWYCTELVWAAYFNQGIDINSNYIPGIPIAPNFIAYDDDVMLVGGHGHMGDVFNVDFPQPMPQDWDSGKFGSNNATSQISVARDPNVKYGDQGYVSESQKLEYKVEFENEGGGIAFGVYFTDTLDADLDDSTLQIGSVYDTADASIIAPPGTYNPSSRTITWFVGEVGPSQGGYANYSIKPKNNLPDYAEIINYATVYFPSVPETTRTNAIVSVIGKPDIGLENVVSPNAIIPLGSIQKTYVAVSNFGYFAENFTLLVYANSTVIHTSTFTLPGKTNRTVEFSWNTSLLAKGNYILSAQLSPVFGEVSTFNNLYVSNTAITIIGDVVVNNVKAWYWNSYTIINSEASGDVNNDGHVEIISAGYYNDGLRNVAQIVVWNSSNLAVECVKCWYWTGNTTINSVALGDVDGDGQVEIVTGGYYYDGTRKVAQLVVWNGADLALENVKTWNWTGDTVITSLAIGDVDGDGQVEIVSGGQYNDGTRNVAELCVWNGTILSLENVKSWYWSGDTAINSVAVGDVDSDGQAEVVTGGFYYDGLRNVAQLVEWNGASLTVDRLRCWYWMGNTVINSVAIGDADGDTKVEVVTGGYYNDGTRNIAQLVEWSGANLVVDRLTTWYWMSDTAINSVAIGDPDSDGQAEVVTGGQFYDGTRDVAQLVVWSGSTLGFENVKTWYWTDNTSIDSVVITDANGDFLSEIITGGTFYDGTRLNSQLTVWGMT